MTSTPRFNYKIAPCTATLNNFFFFFYLKQINLKRFFEKVLRFFFLFLRILTGHRKAMLLFQQLQTTLSQKQQKMFIMKKQKKKTLIGTVFSSSLSTSPLNSFTVCAPKTYCIPSPPPLFLELKSLSLPIRLVGPLSLNSSTGLQCQPG